MESSRKTWFGYARNVCTDFWRIFGGAKNRILTINNCIWTELISEFSSAMLFRWLDVCAHLNASHQHDHTPVENPSVLVVTTGWTQQGVLALMATADTNQADYREIWAEASATHRLPIKRKILTKHIKLTSLLKDLRKKIGSFSVIAKCAVHRCT